MPRDSRLYMTFPIDTFRNSTIQRLPVDVRWAWIEILAYCLGRGTVRVDVGDLALFGDETTADWLTRSGLWEKKDYGWTIRRQDLWGLRSRT